MGRAMVEGLIEGVTRTHVPTIAELHKQGGSTLVEVLQRSQKGDISIARLTAKGQTIVYDAMEAAATEAKAKTPARVYVESDAQQALARMNAIASQHRDRK